LDDIIQYIDIKNDISIFSIYQIRSTVIMIAIIAHSWHRAQEKYYQKLVTISQQSYKNWWLDYFRTMQYISCRASEAMAIWCFTNMCIISSIYYYY